MTQSTTTVGILYPGEMGSAVATLLVARGVRVISTLQRRSDRSAERCRRAGVIVLDSLAHVVRESDVVLSLVPPGAAENVAADYCRLAATAPAQAIYVDGNSIGPELAGALSRRIADCGHSFVDAAINGLAKNLATSGTLFLSGERADEVAQLFDGAIRLQLLGREPGRASAMKMLLAGLSKGVCGLFVELALMAQRQGMLAEMLEASAQIYPGMMAVIDRMLPTYAQHARRRATEMRELEKTARAAGIQPRVIAGVRRLHELLAVSIDNTSGATAMTVTSLIEQLDPEVLVAVEALASQPAAM